jgi:predicted ATPase with chaperone activity
MLPPQPFLSRQGVWTDPYLYPRGAASVKLVWSQAASRFVHCNSRLAILYGWDQAPAELPKQAASFDLPITLGILAASGQIASERFASYAVVSELALDGATRPTRGALSTGMVAAKQRGPRGLEFFMVSGTDFRSEDPGITGKFAVDDQGNVKEVVVSLFDQTLKAKRKQ